MLLNVDPVRIDGIFIVVADGVDKLPMLLNVNPLLVKNTLEEARFKLSSLSSTSCFILGSNFAFFIFFSSDSIVSLYLFSSFFKLRIFVPISSELPDNLFNTLENWPRRVLFRLCG